MVTKWNVLESIATLENPWLKLVCEYLQDDQGRFLTYWRVKRPDSVLIIPIQNHSLILPQKYYRHGVQKMTYDFPGGRHNPNMTHAESAVQIVQRELGLSSSDIVSLEPIHETELIVDSSFSNQRVYAFEAQIDRETAIDSDIIAIQQPADAAGAGRMLEHLTCMQCRCALLQWMADRFISQNLMQG